MLTTTALLFVLAAQPAFLSDGTPRTVRLAADAPLVEAPPDYRGWSKAQLRVEYDRLAATRPGIGLPIALMATGGGTFLTAFYIFLLAGGLSGGPGAIGAIILLAVVGTVAAGMIIIGGIVLSRALPDRRAIGQQMDAVEKLASEREDREERQRENAAPPVYEEPPIIGPPPEGPPPLPLPPMPQSSILTVPIFVARF